jgi:hypothetical protein
MSWHAPKSSIWALDFRSAAPQRNNGQAFRKRRKKNPGTGISANLFYRVRNAIKGCSARRQ